MRKTVLLLVVAIAALGLMETSAVAAPKKPKVITSGCPSVIVLGIRASGQSMKQGPIKGFGSESGMTAQALVDDFTAVKTVRYVAVEYPAVKVPTTREAYAASVKAGRKEVLRLTAYFESRCRTSKKKTASTFVVIGFSQGAQVAREAALAMPSRSAKRVAMVALIGDPSSRGADEVGRVTTYGGEGPTVGGVVGEGKRLPAFWAARSSSFCHVDDTVCNRPEGGGFWLGDPDRIDTLVHRTFFKTAATAADVAGQLHAALAPHSLR